jgi:hypothetical protein
MRNTFRNCAALAAIVLAPLPSFADTIFSDTFGAGSTINAAPAAPTANSASYQTWAQGANPANFSVGPGALHFEARNTSSVFAEVQAQFASSPVALASVGDYVHFTMVFTDTLNVLLAGQNASSQLTVGLFSSGGSLPHQGSRLDAGTDQTGGAAGWNGYINRIFLNGNANVLLRGPQATVGATGDLSRNQDLLFNNAGTGAFNSPTATSIGSLTSGFTSGLTQGNQYTMDFWVMMTAPGTLTVSNTLYSGVGAVGPNMLFNEVANATGANVISGGFDGFGFGWRRTATTSGASSLDVNSIQVDTNVPEPTVGVLSVAGLTSLVFVRRWLRRRRV